MSLASKGESSSFFVGTNPNYIGSRVARISHNTIERYRGPAAHWSTDSYVTVMELDTPGCTRFSAYLYNSGANGLTYTIESRVGTLFWAGVPNYVDQALATTASVAPNFEGAYDRIRIRVRATVGGSQSRLWADLNARN